MLHWRAEALGCVCCCFFSSRRRHTRCSRDWSSDVCSSDLRLKIFRLFIPRLELLDHLSHFPQRFLIALFRAEKRHGEEYPCTHECKHHPYHSRWGPGDTCHCARLSHACMVREH